MEFVESELLHPVVEFDCEFELRVSFRRSLMKPLGISGQRIEQYSSRCSRRTEVKKCLRKVEPASIHLALMRYISLQKTSFNPSTLPSACPKVSKPVQISVHDPGLHDESVQLCCSQLKIVESCIKV